MEDSQLGLSVMRKAAFRRSTESLIMNEEDSWRASRGYGGRLSFEALRNHSHINGEW
jgi:hypothetical protein